MWCTPLECDLLGAHRTNHPRVQSMWTRMRITRCTPRNSPKGPCLGTLSAPFRAPSQGERARTKRIFSRIGRKMRFVGEVELVCAGSSKPLLRAWMWSSTCAASAAPVAQTAASFKIEQKSLRSLQILFLRCSPHRCPFEQLGHPAFCQHLGGHLRGAHRANRMSGSAHEDFKKSVTYYLCGAHHTDGTSNAIYSGHTVQIAQGCNLCGVHRSNAIYSVHTVQITQGCNLCGLECELRGAHRATRPRGPA